MHEYDACDFVNSNSGKKWTTTKITQLCNRQLCVVSSIFFLLLSFFAVLWRPAWIDRGEAKKKNTVRQTANDVIVEYLCDVNSIDEINFTHMWDCVLCWADHWIDRTNAGRWQTSFVCTFCERWAWIEFFAVLFTSDAFSLIPKITSIGNDLHSGRTIRCVRLLIILMMMRWRWYMCDFWCFKLVVSDGTTSARLLCLSKPHFREN